MFENVAGKIKKIAKIVCYAGIVISILSGIATIIIARGAFSSIITGLLIAGLGSVISWLGAIITYGFGQLIENSDILASGKKLEVNTNSTKNEKRINTLKKWKEEGLISEEDYNQKVEELQ